MELFDQKGYAATTVREIVEAAGVTKPVLYYHYGNKEGIYLALMEGAYAAFSEALSAAGRDGRGPRERILGLCDALYALTCDKLPLVRVLYSFHYGPPMGAPPFDFEAVHRDFQQTVRKILEAGFRSGALRSVPVEDALWAVVGPLNVAIEVDLCHPEQSLGREGLKRTLNLVFDGLASPR